MDTYLARRESAESPFSKTRQGDTRGSFERRTDAGRRSAEGDEVVIQASTAAALQAAKVREEEHERDKAKLKERERLLEATYKNKVRAMEDQVEQRQKTSLQQELEDLRAEVNRLETENKRLDVEARGARMQ